MDILFIINLFSHTSTEKKSLKITLILILFERPEIPSIIIKKVWQICWIEFELLLIFELKLEKKSRPLSIVSIFFLSIWPRVSMRKLSKKPMIFNSDLKGEIGRKTSSYRQFV